MRPAPETIVVGVDDSSGSLQALGCAVDQADWHGLPLTVVHCWYFNHPPMTMVRIP